MDKLCRKPTLIEKFKRISLDFQGEQIILLVDLASAEKYHLNHKDEINTMILIIREDFSKIYFST